MANPTSNTPTSVSGLFKKVYASLEDLIPEGYVFQKEIAPFLAAKKSGESVSYSIVLAQENGISFMGADGSIGTFADPQSGQVKEAVIKGCESFVSTGISTAALSRSASEGEASFKKASVQRVKANLKSHFRFLEQVSLYGQDAAGIGRVGYFTSSWKGVAFTNGGGTLAGVVFTAGINAAAKKILINPADQASGIYLGAEGCEVSQRAVGGAIVASGKITQVDLDNGILTVDFTPVAATTATSHAVELLGQNSGGAGLECLGAKGILTKSGVVFGIDNSIYGLWKGSSVDLLQTKLTFDKLVSAVMSACNKGLDKDLQVLVSLETWGKLLTEQSALRKYDSSYTPVEVENGSEAIKFHCVNGSIEIIPSRFIRRSDAFCFAKDTWQCIGSSDLTMKVPGLDDNELIQKPISQNQFIFRSYSDKAPICLAPAQSVYISGIDPQSAV